MYIYICTYCLSESRPAQEGHTWYSCTMYINACAKPTDNVEDAGREASLEKHARQLERALRAIHVIVMIYINICICICICAHVYIYII